MSASVALCARDGIGLVIWCGGPGCPRGSVYIPAEEALAKFGPVTCEMAQRWIRCDACGTHGREGKIQLLPSTLDQFDKMHGKPSGTSERRAAELRAAAERREREECAANGWDWNEVYGIRRVWPRRSTS